MTLLRCFLLLFFMLAFKSRSSSQYILNGSAQKNSCNCYTLTQATTFQSGSVWNGNKIDLRSSFDFWFNVYLGCSDAGADGIVFILQPISTSVGSSGEGMGFGGVSPSVGIALDTYQNFNLNDPSFDHISIQTNGNIDHTNDLAGPVAISSTSDNVEDCSWHKLRITWDAATQSLSTYFDGVLRLQKQVDLVATIFNNNPSVYWGFTGATGGAVNLQQFCTALDPIFRISSSNNVVCDGTAVSFTNASESFAPITAYNWTFGDGNNSTLKAPPPHLYAAPGNYKVTLRVTGQDGCERDSSHTVKVAAKPFAQLAIGDTCANTQPTTTLTANTSDVNFQWTVDATTLSVGQQPDFSSLLPGQHSVKVDVTSKYGCGVPVVASDMFSIWPRPQIVAQVQDGCVNLGIPLGGVQTDVQTTITTWEWQVNNRRQSGQTIQSVFADAGTYPASLWAVDTRGCHSDTVSKTVRIGKAIVRARDTTILRSTPTALHVEANGSVQWSPATGLSSTATVDPVATLSQDQTYRILARTAEGCEAADTLQVKVFNGPAIYVPTAFTPNGDGLNDFLLPVYVGIKELRQFAVFNRWGQKVFATTSMEKGWAASGVAAGTYVWFVRAVDHSGQSLTLKGTLTLIR